LNGTLF